MSRSYNELDKRILGQAYGSTEALDNLIILCDENNSRWPGSGDDTAACEFIVGKLEEYGLVNPHMDKLTHPGWIRGTSSLQVTEPIKKEIPCIALPMSCQGEIETDLVFLGDGPVDVYEERKDKIEGNIVMVTSRTPLGMTRRLHRVEKYQRSIIAGAAGWIFMNHYPAYGPPTGGISPIIPAVGVSYEDGNYLIRLLQRKGKVTVRVKTECTNLEVDTWNVVADLPGTGDTQEMMVVGAHYEGHDISVGALDDATGAVCVMEIARILAKERDHLARPMKFICFGAEEIGLFGSWAYVEQHPEEMKDIRFMINLDAAGRAGRQGFMLHGWPELVPFFQDIAAAIGVDIPIWQQVSPYSDHWPFRLEGIPTSTMGDPEEAQKRGGRGFGHTQFDTVDKVDLRAIRECVANVSLAAVRIVNTDNWPVTHRSQEAIDTLVEEQGYTETGALGEVLKQYLIAREDQLRPEAKVYLNRLRTDAGWKETL
jgi:aminopeptidase YwaD